QLVAPITRTPDLWERIEARIERIQRPRFAFRLQRMFALSGALAAGIVLALFIPFRPPVGPPVGPETLIGKAGAPPKPGILDQIDAIRMRDQDPAGTWSETPYSSDAARVLLVGSPNR